MDESKKKSSQDELSLPGPSTTHQSTDDAGHLEDNLSKLTINHKQKDVKSNNGNKDSVEYSREFWKTKKIDGCYVNLFTDFDETNVDGPITEWQCVYCLFINTRLTHFCNLCSKVPIDNANPKLAKSLRFNDEKLVEKFHDYIVDYCHSLKKGYIDDEFEPNLSSLYYNRVNKKSTKTIKWKRIRDTVSDNEGQSLRWVMYRDPRPIDVIQNELEDCWLLAALAAIASRKSLLYALLGTGTYCQEGVYKIRLFKNGKWTTILIDDFFPCDNDGRLIYAKGPNKQLWPLLLEKAVAKLFGCYESLVSGWPVEGFVLLTGQPCETVFMHNDYFDDNDTNEVDFDLIWEKLLSAKDSGYIMATTCNNVNLSDDVYRSVGLHRNHAYTILNVCQIKTDCIIQLYDPQTVDMWRGDWPLQAYKRISEFRIKLASYEPGEPFWMPYYEYVKYFSSVDICKVRHWNSASVEGLLLPFVMAKSLSYYLVTVRSQRTEVHLTLFQDNQRYKEARKRRLMDLSIFVFKIKNGSIIDNFVQYSGRHIHSFVSCSGILDPGEYIVIPLAFNHFYKHFDLYPRFVLNIHSTSEVLVNHVETSDYLLSDIMIKIAITNGTKYEMSDNLTLHVFTKNWSGGMLLLENRNQKKWVKFHCNCGDSKNVIPTRKSLETFDLIPPLSCQIINVLTRLKFIEQFQLKLNYEYRLMNDKLASKEIPHYPEIDCRVIGLHCPRPLKL